MEIIKSFRKTITLKIDSAGKLIVNAPFFISQKHINEFILKHKNWIEKKTQEVVAKIKEYKQWEKFLFLWDEYELRICSLQEELWEEYNKQKLYFTGREFLLEKKYKKDASLLFQVFYKIEAKKYISQRSKFLAEKFNLEFKQLKITSAKTRWWSCTNKQNINFSYRLIMAPRLSVDYVIIHELAHLEYMNHSKLFWEKVENMFRDLYFQDYKTHKKWLTDNASNMMF